MPPANRHPRGSSMPPYNSSALAYRDMDRSPSPTYSRSRRSGRSRSSSVSSRRSRGGGGGDESPLSRVRSAVEDHFTNSTTGIGASVVGAMAGGYAANKASGMAFNHHQREKGGRHGRGRHHRQRRHSGGDERNVPQAVSTLLGAVAGGLGANAIAHRVEESRDKKSSRHQLAWDGGSRRSRDDDYDDYDDDYGYDDRRYGDRRYDYEGRYDDSRYRRHRDAEEYR